MDDSTSKPTVLLVPIHFDALFLEEDQVVSQAQEDFDRQPYSLNQRDYNPHIAPISEQILSQPFENGLSLAKGLHLHWALPDALCKSIGIVKELKEEFKNKFPSGFPILPNRWLVTRTLEGDKPVDKKHWLVESDYLHPPASGHSVSRVSVPHEGEPPFRYMGRCIPLDSTGKPLLALEPEPGLTYWGKHLTALAFGDPAFSGFYPSCHSVFGCHDSKPSDNKNSQYDVIGWHSDKDQDFFQTFVSVTKGRSRDAEEEAAFNRGEDYLLTRLSTVSVTNSLEFDD